MTKSWTESKSNNVLQIQLITLHVNIFRGPVGPDWRTYAIPFDAKLKKKKKFKKLKGKRFRTYPKLFQDRKLEEMELWENFNALCRGEDLRGPQVNKNLTCYNLHNNVSIIA